VPVTDTITGIQPMDKEIFSKHSQKKRSGDGRGKERIRVKFADREMQRKEYQIIIHSNPLSDRMSERRWDMGSDTYKS